MSRPFARVRSAGTRSCAAAVVLLAVAGCQDDLPTAAGRPEAAPRAAALLAAPAAASQRVRVSVPASMRGAPFDVPRELVVPPGFAAEVVARVPGARFLAVAPDGSVLVSNPGAGRIVRVRAGAGDPTVTTWASGLYKPHDIVVHEMSGTTWIYVAEGDKVVRYRWDAASETAVGRQLLIAGLPSESDPELRGAYGHELKNIAVGSDHRIYVSIASTCNACTSDVRATPMRGAIHVYDANGGGGRLFARGIRNAEGLAFVPGSDVLWVVVNQRDQIAYPFRRDFDGDGSDDYGRVLPGYVDDHPPEAFTRVVDGGDYGWPFCNPNPDAGVDDMPFDRDVQLNGDGAQRDCAAATRISKGMPAHSAPLGLTFLQGTAAPSAYREGAAVAFHGSWNRTSYTGYKVVHFPWNAGSGRPGAQQDLFTGWLTGGSYWGRPVDVAVEASGALLVSDDHSGTIYRFRAGGGGPPPTSGALVGRQSGRCLDVRGGSRVGGAEVLIWDCHGQENQRWELPAVGTAGPVRVFGTLCLDASGGASDDGTALITWDCHGGANQQWVRTAAGELRGVGGKCADVSGASPANGGRLILWSCHGGDNQRWDAP